MDTGRVVFWLVVAAILVLLLRPTTGDLPEGCSYADYGRDAYLDCTGGK